MQDAKTIERIAGQRIMAGFHGTDLNHDLRFLIDTIGVGGIILFSRNITGRQQLKTLCRSAAEYARSCDLPPLLIAIDQEGGTVARLKGPDFTEFKGAPFIRDGQDADAFAHITAKELCAAGINMNMAPVMDVAPPGFDSIMSKRVFGGDPRRVGKIGCTVIRGLQDRGIMAVAKHFPGIGRTTLDSHMQRPDLDASMDSLEAFDLIPFHDAVAVGVSGIMLSHVRYTGIDPVWPASLSPAIAESLLRNKMSYKGVVLTDDLEMGAICNHYDTETIMRQVMDAGIDIALICKTKEVIMDAFDAMCRQIRDRLVFREKADGSDSRIRALKARLG